jgi:glycosyltransferase involved in cell wall biosynthesis
MRLLVTVERVAPTGGAELSTLQLTRELAGRGHEVDLLYESGGELEAEYSSFCRSVTQGHLTIRQSRLPGDLAAAAPSIWRSKGLRPDVVYVQLFGEVLFGALVARLVGVPLVCHLRGFNHYRRTRLLARQVSRFIAVSHDTRNRWIRAGVDPGRIDVVHNGIRGNEYPFGGITERLEARRTLGLPADAFVALYYGRLDSEKGLEVLLEGWTHLGLPPEQARLVIVGDPVTDSDPVGYLQRLRELAPAGSEWLPMRRDVVTPLHAADVVVAPSFAEGLGRTVIEGMASGRPVVASRVGGIPEVLSGPFDKLMFEAGDAAGLAKKLSELVDWQRHDPGLGMRCRSHIQENFSMQNTADGVEEVLTRVGATGGLHAP